MKSFQRAIAGMLVICIALTATAGTSNAASSAPSTINATSTLGSGSITVTWSAVSGATSYQARVLIGEVPIKTSTAITNLTSRSFTFVGLDFNIPYNVQVRTSDGAWSSYGNAAENPVIPLAGAPSAPAQPTLSVIEDKLLKATWSPPASNGGSPIASYSVQLMSGSASIGAPSTVTGLEVEITTPDTTNLYSVTVAAINEANVKSDMSEASSPIAAEKKAAVVIEESPPANNSPSSGGGGNTSSGGGNTETGTENNPRSGNSNLGLSPSTSPATNQLVQIVSPSPNVPAFTKVIKAKSTTTSKTLISLSKLATPKGSKVSFTVASASKKYCRLQGTSVKNLKAGTCSVTVTVTTKAKKKTTRIVKLIAR